MRRRVFTFASLLSLLLCIATLFLWPASYTSWFEARVVVPLTSSRWCGGGISSAEGRVFFGFLTHDVPRGASSEGGGVYLGTSSGHERLWSWSMAWIQQMGMFGHHWHTFGVLHRGGIPVGSDIETAWAVMLPHGVVAAALALPPLIWLRRRIRNPHRRRFGRCASCGYNLTGNTSGVCPECGTRLAHPAAGVVH